MQVAFIGSLGEVGEADWNRLVPPGDPFLDYRFLRALEVSGSVGEGTGWAPSHALVRDGGRLVAAMPLYVKADSYGEFIFDWGWAHAAREAGIPYYPKLVSAVPFTPATGRRILLAPGVAAESVLDGLLPALHERMREVDASSLHVLFLTSDEASTLAQGPESEARPLGGSEARFPFHRRLTYQFHWDNAGYADFEAYLAALRSPARKQVRKERREAAAHGLTFRTLGGEALGDAEWAALDQFYRRTTRRKGSFPYLAKPFLPEIRRTYAGRVVASLAYDGDRPVAGAFGFYAGDVLYGRYWGALVEAEFLHFELCYYQFIEWAIARGVRRFEAGAQGEHKLKRGFLPAPIHSVHAFAHAGLGEAVAEYLQREHGAMSVEMQELAGHAPFRRGGNEQEQP